MTPEQLQTLRADILATPALLALYNAGDRAGIAAVYNAPADPAFLLWREDAPVIDVLDAVDFDKYTPVDPVDGTIIQTNRLLLIQTKQMNLQNMLVGRETVDATKPKVRAALRDAVITLPAGASGASVSAGGASGVNVMTALTRVATRFEKLFSSAAVATGNVSAGVPTLQGSVSPDVFVDV